MFKFVQSNPIFIPMKAFLEQIAQEICEKYTDRLADLYIVLPSRRSCLYMKYFLAKITKKNMLSPHVFSMDDFVAHIADVQIIDQVRLLFKLYDTYKIFDKDPEHDLEKFAPLGTVILKDFDAIDKYLVEGKQLFEYLEEAKAIERWGENLGKDIPADSTIYAYYEFWTHLKNTFYRFRERLLEKQQAYSGLAYRRIAENLDETMEKNDIGFVVFAGFNQLSTSEKLIMSRLEKRKKAKIYFDADHYYIDNKKHEAGYFFKKYLDGTWLNQLDFIGSGILKNPKSIHLIGVNNKVSQAKVAGDILGKMLSEKSPDQQQNYHQYLNDIGILLPDETMLLPVLHALPVDSTDLGVALKEHINVTMGLTIDKTPLFYLIDNLFTMQKNMIFDQNKQVLVYYKDVINLLKHPFVQYSKKYTTDYEQIQEHIRQIQADNMIYIPLKTLLAWGESMQYYGVFFRNWKGDVHKAITALQDLIMALSELFHEDTNVLENEYLYKFYIILNQLHTELKGYEKSLNLGVFRYFLYEILRNESIPFTGEPLSSVQIMGLLESRSLDFQNIIVLSCNEGVLPKGKAFNSVIPFDIRSKFGMPNYSENDATMAYTFYRLFHRAENIFLIYTTSPSGIGKSEKSRFLTQIEAEFVNMPHIELTHRYLSLELPEENGEKVQIEKEEKIVQKIENYLEKGITPSYINMYIHNPLEFFYRKILALKQPQEIEEHFLTNTFGTIVHQFLENKLQNFIGKEICPDDLKAIYTDEARVRTEIEKIAKEEKGGIVLDTGKNYLLKHIAFYLVTTFLKRQEAETPYFLVNQENTLEWTFQVMHQEKPLNVRLFGKTDRIDIYKQSIRIVDYKTGNYISSNLKAKNEEELLLNTEKGKVIQLLLYKYLLIRNLQSQQIRNLPDTCNPEIWLNNHKNFIKSGFYFFRKIDDGFIEYKLDNEPDEVGDFLGYVENFVGQIVLDMLDQNKTFSENVPDFGLEVLDKLV